MDEITDQTTTAGEFLRRIREKKGETQRNVCSRIGLKSTPYIGQIENGQRNVTPKNLDKIAKAYELTEDQKIQLRRIIASLTKTQQIISGEFHFFYQLIMLPKEIRERIIRAAVAYDSSSNEKKTE